MTKTVSISRLEAISKELFTAAHAFASCFETSYTHKFINGGVEHQFMDKSWEVTPLIKVTRGASLGRRRSLTTVPALSVDRLLRESFACERHKVMHAAGNYQVNVREAADKLMMFIQHNASHIRTDFEIFRGDTIETLQLYIETPEFPNAEKLRLLLTIRKEDIDYRKSNPFFRY